MRQGAERAFKKAQTILQGRHRNCPFAAYTNASSRLCCPSFCVLLLRLSSLSACSAVSAQPMLRMPCHWVSPMSHVQANRVRCRSFPGTWAVLIIHLSPQRSLPHIGGRYPSTGEFILLMDAEAQLFCGISGLDAYVNRPPPQKHTAPMTCKTPNKKRVLAKAKTLYNIANDTKGVAKVPSLY